MFPGVDPTRITATAFFVALAALDVPHYLKIQRYSQFCIETNRTPDWSAFARAIPPQIWRK
jgi:hypothetical protein